MAVSRARQHGSGGKRYQPRAGIRSQRMRGAGAALPCCVQEPVQVTRSVDVTNHIYVATGKVGQRWCDSGKPLLGRYRERSVGQRFHPVDHNIAVAIQPSGDTQSAPLQRLLRVNHEHVGVHPAVPALDDINADQPVVTFYSQVELFRSGPYRTACPKMWLAQWLLRPQSLPLQLNKGPLPSRAT